MVAIGLLIVCRTRSFSILMLVRAENPFRLILCTPRTDSSTSRGICTLVWQLLSSCTSECIGWHNNAQWNTMPCSVRTLSQSPKAWLMFSSPSIPCCSWGLSHRVVWRRGGGQWFPPRLPPSSSGRPGSVLSPPLCSKPITATVKNPPC